MNNKDAGKNGAVLAAVKALSNTLKASGLRVRVDDRAEIGMIQKRYKWERKGVPLRLEIGARDLESGTAVAKLRTGGDKFIIKLGSASTAAVCQALEDARLALQARTEALKTRLTFRITCRDQFEARLLTQEPGYLMVPWGGDSADEERLQQETGATLRCYPFEQATLEEGQLCPLTGKQAREWAV